MKKIDVSKNRWKYIAAIVLLVFSTALYLIHYLIYKDAKHIFIYLIGDLAFIPLQVLIVSFLIQKFLDEREKKAMLKKMNMVIGAFFSQIGIWLLNSLKAFCNHSDKITLNLIINGKWGNNEFNNVIKTIKSFGYEINAKKGDLESLRTFLTDERVFMLGLLQNPNLLEHETFTELLQAVFHLAEELTGRESVDNMPLTDQRHIEGDIKRVYSLLNLEWLAYMKHLKENYPYLFSLAIRTNPYDPDARIELS